MLNIQSVSKALSQNWPAHKVPKGALKAYQVITRLSRPYMLPDELQAVENFLGNTTRIRRPDFRALRDDLQSLASRYGQTNYQKMPPRSAIKRQDAHIYKGVGILKRNPLGDQPVREWSFQPVHA